MQSRTHISGLSKDESCSDQGLAFFLFCFLILFCEVYFQHRACLLEFSSPSVINMPISSQLLSSSN